MRPPRPVIERFLEKVEVDPSGCWLWTAKRNSKGYGIFWTGPKTKERAGTWNRAHRVAYRLFVGPIPDGMLLDHLCRVPGCVNPDHLEPVTNRENLLRGIASRRGVEALLSEPEPSEAQ